MMNKFTFFQKHISLKEKTVRSTILLLLVFFSAQNFLFAEGSIDFRNDPGKRLFYWANENQQIKVFANEGEFLNIGASHIGINGGFMKIYKPDGTLAGTFDGTGAGTGMGIINNDNEEMNGPTGLGGGYVPVVQPVGIGEGGVWSVVFSFPNLLPVTSTYPFTNRENNEPWNRATHQPTEWAVTAWDVTVSTGASGFMGGTLLTGRVYTNQYKAIIFGNSLSTSPTFFMMSREGIQYQIDFNDIDPYGFDFAANTSGIVGHNGQPTYSSKLTTDYTVSDDPSTWTAGDFYIYDPQSQDRGLLGNYKIFFNTPDVTMPDSAMTANAFTGVSYNTWLFNEVTTDALEVQNVTFIGIDNLGNTDCFGNNIQSGVGGEFQFTSNMAGTAKISLDINGDGDYTDPEDRVLFQAARAGGNSVIWDGFDGLGAGLALVDGMEINYNVEMRAGEAHILFRDIENNSGGITFTRLNGDGAPDANFYYDHTELGGTTSGGSAPAVSPTTIPFTYSSNWGNNKMLDYWAYQNISGSSTGKFVVNVVLDCSKPTIVDTDGDGILDNVDLDDDNDGIPDANEFCNPNGTFACFPNGLDPSMDSDGDGVANYLDADDPMVSNPCTDADANGICDVIASVYDNDLDGVPDHLDLDSDNDGIPDIVEAGHGVVDTDQDGRIDGVPADFGLNGLYNLISDLPDATVVVLTYAIFDTDGDGILDHDDLDSDSDGIFDVIEAPQADADFNGWVGMGIPKVDANGLPFEDGNGNIVFIIFEPLDLDNDGLPDYRDWDRDGDGIADSHECPDQTNCTDSDGDGIPDADEWDSDDDGIADIDECPTGIPCDDLDNNGIEDYQEYTCPSLAALDATAMDDVLCEGETIELSASALVGTSVSYEWFFNDGSTTFSLGVTTTPEFFINFSNTSNTGIYYVQGNSGSCSTEMSSGVQVNVYDTSSPIAVNTTDSSTPGCEGGNVQLSVPFIVDATYQWFGPNGFNSTQYDPVINNLTPADAGSYYVVVTYSDACATVVSTNTTVFVQAAPAPAAVQSVNNICAGNDLTLTANPLGVPPSANLSFEWFYQNGNSVGTTTSTEFVIPNITQASAGDYYVVMTVGGCAAGPSEMVTVSITPTVASDAGNDQSVCGLGIANLNATMPSVGTGQWTSLTGAIVMDATNPQSDLANLTLGNNIFVWTLSNGNCFNYTSDTVVINYSDATTDLADAGTNFGICDNVVTTLNASQPSSAFGIWTQPSTQTAAGVIISNNTSTTPTITGLVPGNTYEFTWTLSQGTCFNYHSDQVQLQVSATPDINANVGMEESYSCGDDEFSLEAVTPIMGTGTWTTSSNATIASANSPVTMVEDLTVGASTFIWNLSFEACNNYDADTLVVFMEDDIQVTDDEYTINLNERLVNEDVMVNDLIGFVNEYEVTITQEPSLGTVEMVDGIFTYTPDHNAFGVDQFEYQICNVNCADDCETAMVTITLNGLNEKGECWIPNVFTPNGNGKNDAFIIPCSEQFPNSELDVFNRWGDKVYSVVGYNNDWEGTYDGSDLPAGTYYYIFKFDSNDTNPRQGFITISR